MKKSFSAIVQGLKILAANVGAINGITSDINEESDNIAASIKVVNRLNSSLPKLHLAVVSGVSNNTGHFYIPNGDDGSIPIAAVPVSTGSYCNVLITTTGAYHAQITQWNDASIPLENVPVTLLVLYART